jgi:hypothetical protein
MSANSENNSWQTILVGIIVIVVGGVILALIVGEGRFAPSQTSGSSVIIIRDPSQEKASELIEVWVYFSPQSGIDFQHLWVKNTASPHELALQIRDIQMPSWYQGGLYVEMKLPSGEDKLYWVEGDTIRETIGVVF